MKKYIFILAIASLSACGSPNGTINSKPENADWNDLPAILNACKGNAIVVSVGFNPANFSHCQHSLIIRDDSLNVFYEYAGTDFGVVPGDTLKKKVK